MYWLVLAHVEAILEVPNGLSGMICVAYPESQSISRHFGGSFLFMSSSFKSFRIERFVHKQKSPRYAQGYAFIEVESRQISNELLLEMKKLADAYDYLVENGMML